MYKEKGHIYPSIVNIFQSSSNRKLPAGEVQLSMFTQSVLLDWHKPSEQRWQINHWCLQKNCVRGKVWVRALLLNKRPVSWLSPPLSLQPKDPGGKSSKVGVRCRPSSASGRVRKNPSFRLHAIACSLSHRQWLQMRHSCVCLLTHTQMSKCMTHTIATSQGNCRVQLFL